VLAQEGGRKAGPYVQAPSYGYALWDSWPCSLTLWRVPRARATSVCFPHRHSPVRIAPRIGKPRNYGSSPTLGIFVMGSSQHGVLPSVTFWPPWPVPPRPGVSSGAPHGLDSHRIRTRVAGARHSQTHTRVLAKAGLAGRSSSSRTTSAVAARGCVPFGQSTPNRARVCGGCAAALANGMPGLREQHTFVHAKCMLNARPCPYPPWARMSTIRPGWPRRDEQLFK